MYIKFRSITVIRICSFNLLVMNFIYPYYLVY